MSSDGAADRIIIVGAGLAGSTAAAIMGRQGLRVTLIDPRRTFPPVFKAEKIEAHQASLLRKWSLFAPFLVHAGRVREIRRYFNGRMFKRTPAEQYALYYSDMVGALRAQLPKAVELIQNRVKAIHNSAQEQRVLLDSGEELKARLVVLASGLNTDLPSSLGFKRISVKMHHSVAVAFTLARADGWPFPFDAVTYYSVGHTPAVDYLSLFRFRETLRANLFAFPEPDGSWTRHFLMQPDEELERCFPKLRHAIGNYRITSNVESSLIHLYRTNGHAPGVVMIGDAAENVCPSTGMGLTKALTDVDVLCSRYLREWLKTPGMGVDKIAQFSNDPNKCAADEEALRAAIYRQQACTDRSPRWRLHRTRLHFAMQFGLMTDVNYAEPTPRPLPSLSEGSSGRDGKPICSMTNRSSAPS